MYGKYWSTETSLGPFSVRIGASVSGVVTMTTRIAVTRLRSESTQVYVTM